MHSIICCAKVPGKPLSVLPQQININDVNVGNGNGIKSGNGNGNGDGMPIHIYVCSQGFGHLIACSGALGV